MKEDEEMIVVVDILAHFVNISYRKYKWNRLVKVNGEPVLNMRHLACMVHQGCRVHKATAQQQEREHQNCDSGRSDDFIEFDFYTRPSADERRVAVFEVASILASEHDILQKHKIATWCSPELIVVQSELMD